MQYESGSFSPYGDELYPVANYLSQNRDIEEISWTKVRSYGLESLQKGGISSYCRTS